jgi:predicted acylesterase/phospholipase RssA
MKGMWRVLPVVLLCSLLGVIAACTTFGAYTNVPLPQGDKATLRPTEASAEQPEPIWIGSPRCFQRARPWGQDVLALTLSGGGSRAAVFGAAVMLELEDLGALDAVDLVSSVSGGSLPAALYALSRDPDEAPAGETGRIIWNRDNILTMTAQDMLGAWLWRWLRPDSILKYWFTAYDRTDLFADTLNSRLFGRVWSAKGYPTFEDLNTKRPTVILNATSFTAGRPRDFFAFTPWDFEEVLASDICDYDVGHAVAASAAFPGIFHYSTLSKFSGQEGLGDRAMPVSYVHLMDGGASDNLGLKGLDRAMEQLELCGEGSGRPPPADDACQDKRLVIVVDAQNGFQGREASRPDPRRLLDRLVDTNFLDAYDTLMQAGYGQLLRSFRRDVEEHESGQSDGAGVVHLALMTFIRDNWVGYDGQYGRIEECPRTPPTGSALSAAPDRDSRAVERACALEAIARRELGNGDGEGIRNKLLRIDTDWRIRPDEVACLQVAAYALVAGARAELQKFFGPGKPLKQQDKARFGRDKRDCLR